MKGIDLSRKIYEQIGLPMLEEHFKDKLDRIAVGFVGHGSECFGFDDDISQDHDFAPGFSIWLTDEDEERFGFRLSRAFHKLPKEYKGIVLKEESLRGATFRGVQTISSFYRYYTGCDGAPQTLEAWVRIPSFYLAEAINGRVFYDPLGEFSKIRNEIANNMPLDARKMRLASLLFIMAQSGQYNVNRCMKHGEYGAASLAISRFVERALDVIYLLNDRYAPYYKWTFMGARSLPTLQREVKLLETLIGNGAIGSAPETIDEIVRGIIDELILQKYTVYQGAFLEPYAYHIQQTIKDHSLRNAPIILE